MYAGDLEASGAVHGESDMSCSKDQQDASSSGDDSEDQSEDDDLNFVRATATVSCSRETGENIEDENTGVEAVRSKGKKKRKESGDIFASYAQYAHLLDKYDEIKEQKLVETEGVRRRPRKQKRMGTR